jgi:mono/diheme cytochrome c family protein
MKGLIKIFVVALLIGSVYSCNDESAPNYQFFPNMYESPSYETYMAYEIFPGEQSAMLPVEGTVARGFSLYDYENTTEELGRAKVELKSPLSETEIDYKRGKELYDIYCGICHGAKGKGQGNLVKREKILGVPSYASRDITEGSIYHVIYYGLNSMGSYANQLNEEERWQVTAYVQKLKAELN